MAKFELVIVLDGEAFRPAPSFEVARILRDIAQRVEDMEHTGAWQTIRDVNGNDVGRFRHPV